MKIQSGYAFLDVKKGRVGLTKKLMKHDIPVVIYGMLEYPSSGDDGESIEFSVKVDKVLLDAPRKKKVKS